MIKLPFGECRNPADAVRKRGFRQWWTPTRAHVSVRVEEDVASGSSDFGHKAAEDTKNALTNRWPFEFGPHDVHILLRYQ